MDQHGPTPRRRTVLRTLGIAAAAGTIGVQSATAQESFEPLGQLDISGQVAEGVVSDDGETVFVAIDQGFVTVDISDPENPRELARRTDTGLSGVLDVKEEGDRVAVVGPGNRTGQTNGMGLYDVSDPSNPELLTFYDTDYSIHNAYLTEDIAFLIDNGSAAVELIDVSNDQPSQISRYSLSGASILHDLWVQDDVVYLNFWNNGTMMLDVSTPSNPTEIGKVRAGSGRRPNNDHYVTVNEDASVCAIGKESIGQTNLGVELWDISDKQNTEFLAELEPPSEPSGGERTSHNLDIVGDYIYTSWYDGGVFVHDISDPSNPEEIASYRDGDASFWTAEVAKAGETVIATDTALLGGGGGLYTFPDPADRGSNQPPVARFEVTPSDPVAGETFTLDASGSSDPDGSIASYEWFVNGDRYTTGAVNDVTLDEAGDYDVELVVTDDDGATDSTSATLTVEPAPNDPPFARIDVQPAAPEVGEEVTLDASASSDPDGEITSYEWSLDGEQVATGPVNDLTFDEEGDYTVELVVTDNDGATSSATETVSVGAEPNDPPFARVEVDPEQPVAGEPFTLDASSSSDPDGDIASYEWSLDGEQVATGPVNELTIDEPGEYTVELVVTDDDGATDTESGTLEVVDGGGSCGDETETASADGSVSWFDDGDTYTYSTRTTNPCSITLELDGSTYYGDLDLYVTYDGRTPTPRDYDDRSAGRGNDEVIEAALDGSTDVGILIDGRSAWGSYTISVAEEGR